MNKSVKFIAAVIVEENISFIKTNKKNTQLQNKQTLLKVFFVLFLIQKVLNILRQDWQGCPVITFPRW